jgi:hypothetical protein
MIFPSVTTVLDPWKSRFIKGGTERGSAVHEACAAIAKGLWPMVDEEYKPYTEAFSKWTEEAVEDVLLVEERLIDKSLFFSGQLDLVVRMKDQDLGKWTLVDLKTGVLTAVWELQLAAYDHLLQIGRGIQAERHGMLAFRGSPMKCKFIQYPIDRGKINLFLNALSLYRYFA